MTHRKWAKFLFLAAPLLVGFASGCGNFWQAPSSGTTTSCTSNCTTASAGNFYILDGGSSPGIIGDSIVSGTLTAISGSPWLLQGLPYSMAIDPAGNFLMVSTTSGVWSFPITNGELGTAVQVTSDATAEAIQVDATSSWLLEAMPGTGGFTLGAVPIDTITGAGNGTEQTVSYAVTNAALQTNQMALSGDNLNLFVALGSGGTAVVSFTSGVATGNNPLAAKGAIIPVVSTSGSALSIAVDPGTTPRLFYVGETLASGGTQGGLRVFNYSSLSTTTLTQATGSPIASGGLAPTFILPLSTGTYAGEYVYVANGQGTSAGNIAGFTITASTAATPTYTIATDTTTATGEQPLGLAQDSTGTFVLEVGSAGSPYFDAFTFDSTSLGKLDSELTATTASNSIAIVAAP
jgi:hypothetical protein